MQFCAIAALLLALSGTGRAANAVSPAAPASGQSPEGIAVLDGTGYWRVHATLQPLPDARPVMDRSGGVLLPADQPRAPVPPADWMAPAFDDAGWWRRAGPFFNGRGKGCAGHSRFLSHLALRGKFAVADPAAVGGLTLHVVFRGGLVVHLNGREVRRFWMPEGAIESVTAGLYQAPGRPRPEVGGYDGDCPCNVDNCEEAFEIPRALLRKGTNVLALSGHRAPGTTLCVARVVLRTTTPDAVIPNTRRPHGLQVWNAGPLDELSVASYGDPHEPVRALRLVATPNGAFSGQIVVGCDGPITNLSAKVAGDLQRAGGTGVLPAAALQVRYQGAYGDGRVLGPGLAEAPLPVVPVRRRYQQQASFGALQPVWVTARIPRETPAGDYAGELDLRASGAHFRVPLTVRVCGFTLPDPKAYVTWTDFIQSPDTLALTYDVPFHSARHVELIERSFRLIGEAGAKAVYIPLINRTHFGNEQTMVRWIRGEGEGAWRHDFTVFERYLDTACRHVAPRVVCLYAWDSYCGNTRIGDTHAPVRVSLLDPSTGTVTEIEGPRYDEAGAAAFWRPVADGIRQRLAARGLEAAMMVGIDGGFAGPTPTRNVVEAWKQAAPGLPWVNQTHGRKKDLYGVPIGYLAFAYGPACGYDPSYRRLYGWQRPDIVVEYTRDIRGEGVLTSARLLAEWCLQGGQRGFGRMTADFWGVPALKGRAVAERFALNRWSNLGLLGYCPNWLAPGPDGALATPGFEMIREGVQECEARIVVERALLDDSRRERLGPARAARLQELLDERQRYSLWTGKQVYCLNVPPLGVRDLLGLPWYTASGWQERSERLFDAAAEVLRTAPPD